MHPPVAYADCMPKRALRTALADGCLAGKKLHPPIRLSPIHTGTPTLLLFGGLVEEGHAK